MCMKVKKIKLDLILLANKRWNYIEIHVSENEACK